MGKSTPTDRRDDRAAAGIDAAASVDTGHGDSGSLGLTVKSLQSGAGGGDRSGRSGGRPWSNYQVSRA